MSSSSNYREEQSATAAVVAMLLPSFLSSSQQEENQQQQQQQQRDNVYDDNDNKETTEYDDCFPSTSTTTTSQQQQQQHQQSHLTTDAAADSFLHVSYPPTEKEEWQRIKLEKLPNACTEAIGIESLRLSCSLDDFFQTFLADDAPCSLALFQEQVMNDHCVQVTSWKEVEQPQQQQYTTTTTTPEDDRDDRMKFQRTMTFVHNKNKKKKTKPTSAASSIMSSMMMMKTATFSSSDTIIRTTRHQTLVRYSNLGGIVLQSITHISGIPAADSFFIEDYWWIHEEETTKSEPKPHVILKSRFGPCFTKWSLWRSILEKAIHKRTRKWMDAFCEFATTTFTSTFTTTSLTITESSTKTINLKTKTFPNGSNLSPTDAEREMIRIDQQKEEERIHHQPNGHIAVAVLVAADAAEMNQTIHTIHSSESSSDFVSDRIFRLASTDFLYDPTLSPPGGENSDGGLLTPLSVSVVSGSLQDDERESINNMLLNGDAPLPTTTTTTFVTPNETIFLSQQAELIREQMIDCFVHQEENNARVAKKDAVNHISVPYSKEEEAAADEAHSHESLNDLLCENEPSKMKTYQSLDQSEKEEKGIQQQALLPRSSFQLSGDHSDRKNKTPFHHRWDFDKIFSLLQDSLSTSNVQEVCQHVIRKNKIRNDNKDINSISENNIESCDDPTILVFLGLSGVGKTTTLLHLAGVTFEEEEQLTGVHLQPKFFPSEEDSVLQSFQTAFGSESVTDRLQAHAIQSDINNDGETVILVDGPGLDDTRSLEHQVAHTASFLRVLQHQVHGRVLPVVVLSVDSFGSRFVGLIHALESISRMALLEDDFTSFRYVFTKIQDNPSRWKTKIPQILLHVQERLLEGKKKNPFLLALLNDMIGKVSKNGPIFIEPFERTGQETLSMLMLDYDEMFTSSALTGTSSAPSSSHFVNTSLFFKQNFSEQTSTSLRLELQQLVKEIEDCFDKQNQYHVEQEIDARQDLVGLAEEKLHTLLRLQEVLPSEIVLPFVEEAETKLHRQLAHCRKKLEQELSREELGGKLCKEHPKYAQQILKGLKHHFLRLSQLDLAFSSTFQLTDSDRLATAINSFWMPCWRRSMHSVASSMATLINYTSSTENGCTFGLTVSKQKGFLRWNMACFYELTTIYAKVLEVADSEKCRVGNRNGMVLRVYSEIWQRLQLVVELLLGATEEMLNDTLLSESAADNFELADAFFDFLLDVHDDLANGYYRSTVTTGNEMKSEDIMVNKEWFNSITIRLHRLEARIEYVTRSHFCQVSDACSLFKQLSKSPSNWTSYSHCSIDFDYGSLTMSREFLSALAKAEASRIADLLPDCLRSKHASNTVSSLDHALFDYLIELRGFAQISISTQYPHHYYWSPATAVSDVYLTNKALENAIAFCEVIRGWTGFDDVAILELGELMKDTLRKRQMAHFGFGVAAATAAAAVAFMVPPQR